ncbi:RluA family pseudouridine synthase [Desulfosediminicola flagellatus]|uniref:RluA family pseudouridine synthase n=1 Tax=Desulfosediminicola flagellatus TaxID=2569541 RepID=UPI0010AD78AB|nr:RluA family pseudouridine synthase [Desulfosediminicola flagellatus]
MKKTRPQSRTNKNSSKNKKTADTFTVKQSGQLLDTLIAAFPGKSRKLLKAILRDQQVIVNKRAVTQFDQVIKAGQTIEVCWEKTSPRKRPHGLNIVFEDDQIIVVNKPAGLLTVATDKEKRRTAYAILSDYVKTEDPDNKIFIVHRIDRETSGLLLFAKNEEIKHKIQETWITTIKERTYIAVVEGKIEREGGTITSFLHESKAFIVYSSQNPNVGKKAVTHYKTLKTNKDFSLLQINLETGRKHQIRVHMQDIGHPVVGDVKYGSKIKPIGRLGLHAQGLVFTHPKTNELCSFETPIPAKFSKLFTEK